MQDSKKIKCLIVDDEPAARDVIARYIQQLPMAELAGECSNALQVINVLQHQQVDLMFLDIHMPQLNGTDLLRVLKNPPKTIFTTAHEQYALQGYDLDAIDYLLKPIQFDRFLKAVQKAMQINIISSVEQSTAPAVQEPFVYFRADRKMVKVLLKNILYIESMKDYVKVYTTNGLIITKLSISSLQELLPEKNFIRTHRSFIVSLEKVKSFTPEIIEIENAEVPIGKLYRQMVLKVLG
jgi:two-component system, LytTR family, response regulator